MDDATTTGSPSASGRVACYFGGRRGMGHLTRQATLLRALRELEPTTEFLLHMKAPDRHVLRDGEFPTVVGRADAEVPLAATLERFRPDLLLFDTLLPKEPPPHESLERPRPAAVLTLRRVRPERLDGIFESPWMDWVRLLLIPHTEEEFPAPPPRREGLQTRFTGPILAERPPADLAALRRRYGIEPDEPLVVASLGGGGVPVFAQRFAETVLTAFARLRSMLPRVRLVLVTGPKNQGSVRLDAWTDQPEVRVVDFDANKSGFVCEHRNETRIPWRAWKGLRTIQRAGRSVRLRSTCGLRYRDLMKSRRQCRCRT